MNKYNFAGKIVAISGDIPPKVLDYFEKYKIGDDEKENLKISIKICDIRECDLPLCYASKNIFVYKEKDIVITQYGIKEKPRVEISHNEDISDIKITLTNDEGKIVSNIDFVYMYIGAYYFYHMALYENALMLHGSAIKYGNNAIVFTAPSGTGKSTHTRLWKKTFDSVEYINDDKPLLKRVGGEYFAYGTPFSGKEHIDNNIYAPLRAIVLIERAEKNSIDVIDKNQVARALTEEIMRTNDNKAVYLKNLELLDEVSKNVPIFVLKCNTNIDAVDVVISELNKNHLLK